jgi:chromosome segregation ATPase
LKELQSKIEAAHRERDQFKSIQEELKTIEKTLKEENLDGKRSMKKLES